MKPKAPTIPMLGVKSSLIESIGHLGDTLAVKFKTAVQSALDQIKAETGFMLLQGTP